MTTSTTKNITTAISNFIGFSLIGMTIVFLFASIYQAFSDDGSDGLVKNAEQAYTVKAAELSKDKTDLCFTEKELASRKLVLHYTGKKTIPDASEVVRLADTSRGMGAACQGF